MTRLRRTHALIGVLAWMVAAPCDVAAADSATTSNGNLRRKSSHDRTQKQRKPHEFDEDDRLSHRSLRQTGDLFGDADAASVASKLNLSVPKRLGKRVYFTPEEAATRRENKRSGMGDARIVGGNNASPTVDRFFTMILRKSATGGFHSAGCGASLISNCYVLTAAHCVEDSRDDETDAVYVSAYEPYDGNPNVPYHFTTVTRVLGHEGYISNTNRNDVALLKMAECVNTQRFPTVELARPGSSPSEGDIMQVLGFGRNSEFNKEQVRTLQKVSLPYIPAAACANKYRPEGLTVFSDMICAGYANGGKDSCQGDSGGPLIRMVNGKPTQYGVVSWGVGCARAGLPGVYASIQYHFEWIRKRVCDDPDSDKTSSLCSLGDVLNIQDSALAGFAASFPTPRPTPQPTTAPTHQPIFLVNQFWWTPPPTPSNGSQPPSTRAPTRPPTRPPTQVPTPAPVATSTQQQATTRCDNSQGTFAVTIGGSGSSLHFRCKSMAPGERGHAYCWETDQRLGQTGLQFCPGSCDPQCLYQNYLHGNK